MSRLSLPLFAAWRQTLRAGYSWKALRGDLSAGLTVGIIAIPLAMALAIAVGVAPQHGLYTVLIAAPLIAVIPSRNENSAAAAGATPRASAAATVEPLREMPGKIATACATPINSEPLQVGSS